MNWIERTLLGNCTSFVGVSVCSQLPSIYTHSRWFRGNLVSSQASYTILLTINHFGVSLLRLNQTDTAEAHYFINNPALSSIEYTLSTMLQFTHVLTPFHWSMSGKVISISMPSDFIYSTNFLEEYSLHLSKHNYLICFPDSIFLHAFHCLKFSSTSNLYITIYSSIEVILVLMKSSIYSHCMVLDSNTNYVPV